MLEIRSEEGWSGQADLLHSDSIGACSAFFWSGRAGSDLRKDDCWPWTFRAGLVSLGSEMLAYVSLLANKLSSPAPS